MKVMEYIKNLVLVMEFGLVLLVVLELVWLLSASGAPLRVW
jgi:hypothetical protein